jgi:hypothetical protein
MEKSLKKTIDETPIFASLPIAFIDDNLISNDSDAENVLYDVVRLLHKIDTSRKNELLKFFEIIDEDDFFKIKLFLTERLYCLRRLDVKK